MSSDAPPQQACTDFKKVKLTKKMKIDVWSLADMKSCSVGDMVVLSTCNILLTDWNNESLKIVDVQTGRMLSVVQLLSSPDSLCLLPGNRAAVTLIKKKEIQIIDVSADQLTLRNSVNVKGRCCGLANMNDTFIVGFMNPGCVAIVNFEGKRLKSVSKDNTGKLLFSCPRFICVATEKNVSFIYVSDRFTNTIARLSEELDVLQTIKSPNEYEPFGVAATGGGQLLRREWHVKEKPRLCVLDTNTMVSTVLLEDEVEGTVLLFIGRVAICPRLGRVYFNTGWLDNMPIEFIQVYEIS